MLKVWLSILTARLFRTAAKINQEYLNTYKLMLNLCVSTWITTSYFVAPRPWQSVVVSCEYCDGSFSSLIFDVIGMECEKSEVRDYQRGDRIPETSLSSCQTQ